MTLLKGLSSARSKTVCEIRIAEIADQKRTENLSKISLRRQSKFTKSERLCSIKSYSRTDLNDLVSLIFTSLLMLSTGKHSDAIKLRHG